MDWKKNLTKLLDRDPKVKVHVDTVIPTQKLRPAQYVDSFTDIASEEKEEKIEKVLINSR